MKYYIQGGAVLFILRVALPKNVTRRAACRAPERSESAKQSTKDTGVNLGLVSTPKAGLGPQTRFIPGRNPHRTDKRNKPSR